METEKFNKDSEKKTKKDHEKAAFDKWKTSARKTNKLEIFIQRRGTYILWRVYVRSEAVTKAS